MNAASPKQDSGTAAADISDDTSARGGRPRQAAGPATGQRQDQEEGSGQEQSPGEIGDGDSNDKEPLGGPDDEYEPL